MRIGFLTPEFVTERYFSGGLAQYIYRISRSLVSRGHEVYVITWSEDAPGEFEHTGIHVCRINNSVKLVAWLNRLSFNKLRSTIKLLALSYMFYKKLKQLHMRNPFDVVQYANYNSCGLVPSLMLNIPFMLRISTYAPTWHEHQGIKRTLDTKAVELLEWLQLRISPTVYAPSYTLKQLLEEKTAARNVRVLKTPFFMETEDWDRSVYEAMLHGKKYLLFFGRLQLHKGIHILAHALPRVFKKHADCHVAIVGMDISTRLSASMQDYVRSCCGEYGDRIVFIGQIPHAQLYPVIKGARLVVLPSLIDNLPNACLEAMALGKPVVGTYGASFEELITNRETGFLVTAGDADKLADTLCEAWMHPRLDEIGQAARDTLGAYEPHKTVQEFLSLAKTVIDKSYAQCATGRVETAGDRRRRSLCPPQH